MSTIAFNRKLFRLVLWICAGLGILIIITS